MIRNLRLLENCERDKILNTWNDTDTTFPETSTVDVLISQQAQRSPDAIALKYANNTLSYAELDARANQLARELRCQSVTEGDFVALCLPRSLDLIVGLIGIMKTGAAYVPIDPSYPEDRIQFLLEDSGASHILSNDNLYERYFSRQCARLISIGGDATSVQSLGVEPIERKLGPEGLLYMIYTSGSTGRPKGVSVKHAVVHPKKDSVGNESLIAYVIVETNQNIDKQAGDILTALGAKLPAFMVPDAVLILDAFPLMANQKVDRAKLPMAKIQLKSTVEYRAPASDIEVQVAGIWQKYLNLERVGLDDDFFDLGGNSLRAVALLDEIGSATGVAVSLSQLFTCRTLSGLCNNMLECGAKPAPVAILLNSNANLGPIFFVCGIQLYQELAFRISEEYSAYGIFLPEETAPYQSDADNDEFEKFPDVKEYASRYIEAIRAQQPQGPYRVAGVSFGGILAYEINRQIKALGEQVESVYLFDSILPSGKQYSVSRRLKNPIKSVRDDAYGRIQKNWKRLVLSRIKKHTSSHMQACAVSAELNESRLRGVRDRNY